ncbi:PREDICTED: histone H1t-like [Chrysochloris asiatica]|uniref:Histone H1t-like n=1 Tax=Chrysochloris asiatica TaxID=185453 RepID=A0A9B0TZA0_CHRAS|nr:PREDICTED: histone H1t-like [Chrysochloris asiatica]
MSETAPAVPADPIPAPMEKPPAKKRGRKPVGLTGASLKTSSPSVSKLIIEALSRSQERTSMSLAALKKALTAAGYDVERNNSRIKLGLKSLVNKGILVQTRGTGASGSFKLNKKADLDPIKGKVRKPASGKAKKLVLSRDSRSTKGVKTNKRAKQARAAGTKKAAKSGRKAKGAKIQQQRRSPAKAKTGKLKTGKPKLTQQKINPRKAALKK